jgi:sialic acid synthase SpsE
MSTLHNAFGVPVGFSDHSEGFMAAALSISLGAVIIEKHFTLDKNLPGPDHLASSTPAEFRQMIEYVRLTEEILGNAYKRRQAEENDMANTSRKSISINKVIKSGERLKAVDLCLIRPGTGVSSKFLSYFEGKIARANLLPGQLLKFENVE